MKKIATPRFPALDGWRGISILLVLAGHLFPLGPKSLNLNEAIPALGMAIFFTLSGLLITTTLLHRPSVTEFLTRRLCRIVPLAWLFTVVALFLARAPVADYVRQMLFVSNLPPFWLTQYTGHLWSLSLEMQFYAAIALVFAIFGKRGLWCIPAVCMVVTANRIEHHELLSIVTSVRVDEILAGGTLALVCNGRLPMIERFLRRMNPLMLLPFAIAASNTLFGPLDYLRPYIVASMVGSTLFHEGRVSDALKVKWLAYIASISFALYILHPMVGWGWLGEGTKAIKYAKRIPALAAVFWLAHLSTFYFEDFWICKGKEWGKTRPLVPLPE